MVDETSWQNSDGRERMLLMDAIYLNIPVNVLLSTKIFEARASGVFMCFCTSAIIGC